MIEIVGALLALSSAGAVVARPQGTCVTSALGLLVLCVAGIGMASAELRHPWVMPAVGLGALLTVIGVALERRKRGRAC